MYTLSRSLFAYSIDSKPPEGVCWSTAEDTVVFVCIDRHHHGVVNLASLGIIIMPCVRWLLHIIASCYYGNTTVCFDISVMFRSHSLFGLYCLICVFLVFKTNYLSQ